MNQNEILLSNEYCFLSRKGRNFATKTNAKHQFGLKK